jgi:hypothetical protein
MDELAVKDDIYHSSMVVAAELYKINLAEGRGDPNEFLQIVRGTHPNIKPKKDKADALVRWVRLCERLTFACLVLGFIWAIMGPLIL